MKTTAAVLCEMGRPAPYAQPRPLIIDDVELDGPGPGEVLVRVAAASLCHSDLSVIDGSRPRVMPMVLGHEASGVVEDVGSGVTAFSPGDHVVFSWMSRCGQCRCCIEGRPWLCENGIKANVAGALLNGSRRLRWRGSAVNHHVGVSGFARHAVVMACNLVKIDPAYPLDKAALFGCAVMTGVGAVVNTAGVRPGEPVAVFGLGGVGLSAVMGAAVAGAYPLIAVDVLDSKLELARQAGATHTVNAANVDAVQAIRDITASASGGGGVEYAIESVGKVAALQQAYASTRRGGTTVTIGLPPPDQLLSVPAVQLANDEKLIRGSYMGSCIFERDVPRFIALAQAGKLPVHLLHTHTIQLSDINEAFDTLAAGEAVRQIITF
jgi:alcohol dehydrogenase